MTIVQPFEKAFILNYIDCLPVYIQIQKRSQPREIAKNEISER